jgi:hypothetical protein
VVRHIFKLARCGYTLRVTSQASYSPEYITPTQKNHEYFMVYTIKGLTYIKKHDTIYFSIIHKSSHICIKEDSVLV